MVCLLHCVAWNGCRLIPRFFSTVFQRKSAFVLMASAGHKVLVLPRAVCGDAGGRAPFCLRG